MRGRRVTVTDLYLAAVEQAVARPGAWIDVRGFEAEVDAGVIAHCLAEGYLPVDPRGADTPSGSGAKANIKTAAPVETSVDRRPDGWWLRIRGRG
jgi:hypothetical protein